MKKILLTFVGMALSALPFLTSAFAQTKATADEAVVKAVTQAAETYSFQVSDEPTKDNWAANTHWYTLKLSTKYLKFVKNQNYISLDATVNPKNPNNLWMFVEGQDGNLKIYNAAAGVDSVLASVPTQGDNYNGNIYPVMTSVNDLTEKKGTWECVTSQNGFFLKLAGTTKDYMNDFDGNGKLAFWNEADAGSTFQVTPVEATIVFSDAPTDGNFAQNTTWYYLKLRTGEHFTKYLNYDEARTDRIGVPQMPTNAKTPATYGDFWAFVKGTDGKVKIYNAATGPTCVLASAKPTGDGHETYPCLKQESQVQQGTETCEWTLNKTPNGENTFGCFKLGVSFDGQEPTYYLSDWGGTESTELRFWNGDANSDQGYNCYVEEVDIASLISQEHISQDEQNSGCVGAFVDNSKYTEFETALKKNSATGLSEALKICSQSENVRAFDANKYYRIKNKAYPTHCMTMAINVENPSVFSAKGQTSNNADPAQVWCFTANGDGYKLGTQSRFLKKVATSTPIAVTEEATPNDGAAKYFLDKLSPIKFVFNADGTGEQDRLHEANSRHDLIVGWGSDDDASQWYLMPATTIEVSVSAAGYTTVNYPFAVQLPETGLQAFVGRVAQSKGQDVFVLRELRDKMIPANTPMILAGTQGTYTLTILDKNTEVPSIDNNPLAGTYMQKTMQNGEDTYVLSLPQGYEVGFYKLEDTGDMQNGATPNRLIPSNKAYLPGSSLPQTTAQTYGFAFSLDENGGGTTGIEEETVTDLSKEEFFDLQGRRVMKPSKGIFVTKSGKKVLFF